MEKNKKEAIVRTRKNRENPYVMVDKYGINDERLSWKAKGILIYLLSKPDDWTVRVNDLVKHAKDGRDAVLAGLKELETHGYVSREYTRENGKFSGLEYIIYERPQTIDRIEFSPKTENPSTENPSTENPTLLIKDNTNNNSTNKKDDDYINIDDKKINKKEKELLTKLISEKKIENSKLIHSIIKKISRYKPKSMEYMNGIYETAKKELENKPKKTSRNKSTRKETMPDYIANQNYSFTEEKEVDPKSLEKINKLLIELGEV